MFDRPHVTNLVSHKTNTNVQFVAYSFDKERWTYKCRHVSSNLEHPVLEQEFHHHELDVLDSKSHYRRWDEFDIVIHRTNLNQKLITLENLTERGKTKCRWLTTDPAGAIFVHENIFEDFELIKIEES